MVGAAEGLDGGQVCAGGEMTQGGQELGVDPTPIPGLFVVRQPLQEDARGWFKEHWQRAKMTALGLPDFRPVQQNTSFNAPRGVTRGLHAEPWDKYVSVANGRAFGAWVDLRAGRSFGTTFQLELDPATAVYVPRGVANGFQTLEANVTYTYLVTGHWSPNATYTHLNLADPTTAIPWPIPLSQAAISAKDLNHPMLDSITPIRPRETLVIGADGQLGRALAGLLGDDGVRYARREDLDLTDASAIAAHDWRDVGTIINAAAFTAVDDAETRDGRRAAWAVNATAQRDLALVCMQHDITLVSVSTDYVFDGTVEAHQEDEPYSPLSTYGASKAAGELVVSMVPKHYLLRTSWVVGEGRNFIATMVRLAASDINPTVINDQRGRLTHAEDLANAIIHLLTTRAAYGTYNVSNSGDITTWFEIAQGAFARAGADPARVTPVTTDSYLAMEALERPVARRPMHSAFSLAKIQATGLVLPDWADRLRHPAPLPESDQ